MEISKDSWHYRLFHTYAQGSDWDLANNQYTFCSYSRNVAFGAFMAFIVTLLGTVAGLGAMQLFASLAFGLFTDNPWLWFINPYGGWLQPFGLLGFVGISCAAVVGILFVFGFMANEIMRYRQERAVARAAVDVEPGFFATWYRSWKDKFCPVVTLKQK